MLAIVKTDNTIGFNAICYNSSARKQNSYYIHSIIYFLVPLVRLSVNPSYFMVVRVEIFDLL